MPDRAERRRQQRAEARRPVIIAGDGIVATELGHRFEARPHAQLPAKQPGQHRWIATAAYVMPAELVAKAGDPDTLKLLDHENLMNLAIGCWDCERPLGVVDVSSHCPASGDD